MPALPPPSRPFWVGSGRFPIGSTWLSESESNAASFAHKILLMIITIDGPAKSGKSKAGELLAARLRVPLLNTGAMYRAVALMLADQGISFGDLEAVAVAVHGCRFTIDEGIKLNDIDYTDRVGTAIAGQGASQVGELIAVRRPLQAEQRRLTANRAFVAEGRDLGTVVFPDAPVKFYVTASVRVRAFRQQASGDLRAIDEIIDDLKIRDERDMKRALDPLYPATDAIVLSTDHLSAEQVAAAMEGHVAACRSRFTA